MADIHIRKAIPQDAKSLAQAEQHYAQTPGHLVSNPHELREENFAKKIAAGHALLDQMGMGK